MFRFLVNKVAMGFLSIALFFGATTTPSISPQGSVGEKLPLTTQTLQQSRDDILPGRTVYKTTEVVATSPVVIPTQTQTATFNQSNNSEMSDSDFIATLNTMRTKMKQDNPYFKEKTILLDYLYHPPLSADEMAKLPQDMQDLINKEVPIYGPSVVTTQIEVLNSSILDYNYKIDYGVQTQINNYLMQRGLPIQPLPTKTNCSIVSGSMICYTN